MPTTKFKITETTKRTSLKINGVLAVVGQEHDIALQSSVMVLNDSGLPAEPADSFKYKIIVDGIAPVNESTVTINFQTDKTMTPQTVNEARSLDLYQSLFFTDYVIGNRYFDRILITAINGYGSWTYNSSPLKVGDSFFYYQLSSLLFAATEYHPQNAYNIMKWKFGNVNSFFNEENTFQINAEFMTAPVIPVYNDLPLSQF